jgi:hypothetical protein
MSEMKGLFNKEILEQMIAESQNFNDLRDMIYIELMSYVKEQHFRFHPPTRSGVARVLKMNRTTMVELCKRLGFWPLDRMKSDRPNRWGL